MQNCATPWKHVFSSHDFLMLQVPLQSWINTKDIYIHVSIYTYSNITQLHSIELNLSNLKSRVHHITSRKLDSKCHNNAIQTPLSFCRVGLFCRTTFCADLLVCMPALGNYIKVTFTNSNKLLEHICFESAMKTNHGIKTWCSDTV